MMVAAQGQNSSSSCPDPLAAILATLDCIEQEDPVCASQGYNSTEFKKFHNGVDTMTVIDAGGGFWSISFTLVDLSLDFDFQQNVGPNQASLRYVEVVNTTNGVQLSLPPCSEYPYGQTFYQHEHALVTVDDDCKMTLWDQYGDNREQAAVDKAVAAIVREPAFQCLVGILPPEACANVTSTCGQVVDPGDSVCNAT